MGRTELPHEIRIGAETYRRLPVPGKASWYSGEPSHVGRWFTYTKKRWRYCARTHSRYWPDPGSYETPLEAYNGFWAYQRKRALAEYEALDELFVDEMVAKGFV